MGQLTHCMETELLAFTAPMITDHVLDVRYILISQSHDKNITVNY